MDALEPDNSWMNDSTRNETRYAKLIEHSIFPPWTLLVASWKEDPKLLLPRMIGLSILTGRRIPRAVCMKPGPRRTAFVYDTLHSWARRLCRLAKVRLEIKDAANIDPRRTYLFAVNHMSPMDIPALYASISVDAAFVANAQFLGIPIFSYWMRKSQAVFVSQNDPEAELRAFKEMIKRLKRGRSLILFPEGYIFQGEGMAEFKRGGLHAAVLAGVPIVPLCVYGTQHVMRAGSLHVDPRMRVIVEIGKAIDPGELTHAERKDIEGIVYKRLSEMKLRLADESRIPRNQ